MKAHGTSGDRDHAAIVSIHSLCDAQALLTGLDLDLFTTLRSGSADIDTIRRALGLHGRGLADWLGLLVSNGLLEREGDLYRNGSEADRYLARGSASYAGDVLRQRLFPALLGLTESLRTGAPHDGREFMEAVRRPEILRQFANEMDSMTDAIVGQLIEAYDGWIRYGSVLDVGGCRGNVASHILTAHPHLEGHVFDLPGTAPLFAELSTERGLGDKLTFHGGDFFTDDLPRADIVLIGHALVNWTSEQRRFLVGKLFDSVNPGGVLLVYDRMLNDTDPLVEKQGLRLSLSMLVLSKGGSSYTPEELRALATEAGFADVTFRTFAECDTLAICAKKPGE